MRGERRVSRMRRWLRDAAISTFNALVLLAVLELGLVAISTLGSNTLGVEQGGLEDLRRHYLGLSVYRPEPWAETYWSEIEAVADMPYRPFVVWRTRPFDGQHVKVGADGIRHTPGVSCNRGEPDERAAFEVWMFGGSTVWGWGAPDEGTVAAHLGRELARRLAEPVCVVNLGENGYVASQNLIRLEERLALGHRPDLVIFYDGVNNTMGAHHDGLVGPHQNLALYRRRHALHQEPLRAALGRLEITRWLARFRQRAPRSGPDVESLASELETHYLGVLDTVAALGRSLGFAHHAFWQPHITTGAKPLSAEEAEMAEKLAWTVALEPDLVELFRATARRMREASPRRDDLTSVVDVFDDRAETVWIDTWGHVGPEGNAIVARRLAGAIELPKVAAD